MVATARAAAVFAEQVRKRHRRRTEVGSPQRATDIEAALRRLHDAMAPLRSEIARFSYEKASRIYGEDRDKIRDASKMLQRERMKLHKMLSPAQREKIKARMKGEE
jgi:hypothetical protein